jgi:hypothetical protein
MAVVKYLEYDSKTGRFILPEEHAVVFLEQDDLQVTRKLHEIIFLYNTN